MGRSIDLTFIFSQARLEIFVPNLYLEFVRTLLLLLLCLAACSTQTPGSVRRDGERLIRRLTSQLEQIRSREELLHAMPQLRHTFNEMARLAIDAKELEGPPLPVDPELGKRLINEMVRIYSLEGGREIVESAQQSALDHLIHA